MSERFLGLEEITIRNLGVIESAQIEFKPGLNVLTGETGAGKTMVLTALSLILGGKSDADRVRTGAERMVVSGRFSISQELQSALEENGTEIEDGALLVSRTVTADGKSRLQLGGIATTSAKVAELAGDLVEVHAQSSTNRLTKPAFVRAALDLFGNHQNLLKLVADLYQSHSDLSARIDQLRIDQKNRESEVARLTEFTKAFATVNPKLGELLEIEEELNKLSSVDELQQAVSAALNFFEAEEFSVVGSVVNAKRSLDHVIGKDRSLDEITIGVGDSLYALQESLGALHRYLSSLDANPARLDFLQERKRDIHSLIKKFGEGADPDFALAGLILRAQESTGRLQDLEGGADRIIELEEERSNLFKELRYQALELSAARQKTAREMEDKITLEVNLLSMPHAALSVEVTSKSGNNVIDFTQHGIDEVVLLFTSHNGAAAGPITRVASGGELSRVMLAIEVVLATVNPVNTYVFDEIDAGVGGKAAVEVGRRLRLLAEDAQVIVVTHLAQVAVWANSHLVVRKNEDGLVSNSDVMTLSTPERAIEIARMLSGQEDSLSAREHARELLEMVKSEMDKESVIS